MIVNNFDLIKKLLVFEDRDDFYFLQIIQRKKDGCNVYDSGSNGYRRIKTYYIRSLEDLMTRKDKIIELCENNNARAYIHLNVRSAREVALDSAKAYIELVKEGRCEQGHRVYDHICGITPKSKVKKKWIIDADELTEDQLEALKIEINKCRSNWPIDNGINPPVEYDNVIDTIPTVHGYHIITHGFNIETLRDNLKRLVFANLSSKQIKDICDVKKDHPTLLYFKNDN
jgi:hypothetical protein